MDKTKSVFDTLNEMNVNDHTEKKDGLTYLSWAWAWQKVKKTYPTANYEIKKFEHNLPYVFDPNTGYMVFTSVTIDGITHEMFLPVMDSKNKAMKAEMYQYQTKSGMKDVQAATMTDINKTIMRCLTKNLAMHGLGLYIYAGEDLPQIDLTLDEAIKQIRSTKDLAWIEQYAAWAHHELPNCDKGAFTEALNQYRTELQEAATKPLDLDKALNFLHNAKDLNELQKYFKSAWQRADETQQAALKTEYDKRKADFVAAEQE